MIKPLLLRVPINLYIYKMKNYEVIIVGGGAAGLMCAIEAAKRGRKTLIIEKSKSVGEKIRISGGGRCNFTNLDVTKDNFLSNNPNFCISALSKFTQGDFIAMVEGHGIKYHEKTLGQLFCDISSKQIINMLLDECDKYGAEIILQTNIDEIAKKEGGFVLNSNKEIFQCESLVVATGGLSIPKMGATDFGYKIATQFGINIVKTDPALVPFTLPEELLEMTKLMSGVSVFAEVSIGKVKFRENILFTHKGLSGPAILQISSYWQRGVSVKINMAPDLDVFDWLRQRRVDSAKMEIVAILSEILPKKLAAFIAQINGVGGKIADLSNKDLQKIASNVNAWQISPNGSEGYAKAEVTIGGVDCNEVSSKTFEAKKVSGLYFVGEVLDVTGHLGGYNFQWAWSSGFVCGCVV